MIKVRITSTQNLINFLKRLKTVDRSVLLELDAKRLFSKVHTPDKSVMKFSSLDFSEVLEGEIDWKSILKRGVTEERIKIGMIDVGKAIDCFKHFRPEEDVYLEIETDSLDGSCVATQIKLVSKSLYINLRCADLSLLSYVEDNILGMVHAKDGYLAKFKIYQSDFSSIVSLCGLENNSEELLVLEVSGDSVRAKGDSFNYRINVSKDQIELTEDDCSSPIYKNQLSYMESETCDCYLFENRMVLFSEQSNTSIAIGVVIK
jgi:hypothetical protein